jgi:hypothetical protein
MGVKQLICVCPIEYTHYSELKLTPFETRIDSETKAMYFILFKHFRQLYPEMTLLRPNIIFGEESYSIRYLIQSLLAGRVIYPRLKDCGLQKYYPMYKIIKI